MDFSINISTLCRQSCLHESHCPSLIFKYHIFDFSSLTHVFIRVCKRSGVTFDKQSIERLWTKGANITSTFGVVSKPRLSATLPSSISLESRPSLPDLCVSRLASRGSAVAAGWRKREQSFNPLHSYPTFYYYKWIYFYISIHIPGTLVTMFSFSLCLKWMKDNKDNKRYMCIFYFSNFSLLKRLYIFPERCFHFDRI